MKVIQSLIVAAAIALPALSTHAFAEKHPMPELPHCHGADCRPVQPTPKPTPCYPPFCRPFIFLTDPEMAAQVKGGLLIDQTEMAAQVKGGLLIDQTGVAARVKGGLLIDQSL